MTQYFHIEPDNEDDYGVIKAPKLGLSFFQGKRISAQLRGKLVFAVSYPSNWNIPHFIGDTIPIVSDQLVRAFKACGVRNFQIFPSELKNAEGWKWTGFAALNVLGLVRASSQKHSEYDVLMPGLAAFNTLVLDKQRIAKISPSRRLMFRLAESPSTLLIHESIDRYLDDHRPADGWRFDATTIDVR